MVIQKMGAWLRLELGAEGSQDFFFEKKKQKL
jgi:hypothetical protein